MTLNDYAGAWRGPYDEHRVALDRIEHVEFLRWRLGAML